MSENSIPESFKMTELGSLPEEWDVVRLGDVVKKTEQKDPKKSPGWRFKYIDVSSITRENLQIVDYKLYLGNEAPSRAKKLVKNRDVIFATIRPTLKRLTLIDEDFDGEICSTAFCVLRTREDILSQLFLLYAVQRDIFIEKLGKIQRGASYPAVTDSDVKNQKIPLPPLPEQRAIAKVLSTVQGAKEKTETVIETTKALKKSMMKHLFTYGPVPVKKFNELGVNELQNAQNSKNSSNSIKLKETEIGLVPEEWEVKKIGSFAKFQGGYAFKSIDYQSEGVPLFKISNVSFGETDWNEKSYLPYSYLSGYSQFELKPGDLVMAMTRPIVSGGIKIARLCDSDCPCLLNQRVGRFIVNQYVDVDFLFQILFEQSFISSISYGALGSQQPNISANKIEQISIPLPPLFIQRQIASILSTVDKKIEAEGTKKKTLVEVFKSLLQNLMTGKLRVTEL